MTSFKPITKKPGDTIRSEDWNSIQEGLLEEIISLRETVRRLKEYVDNMGERVTLSGLESPVGSSHGLDEIISHLGEKKSYDMKAIGLITKQWVPSVKGTGEICHFGVTDYFDQLHYWSGAENGNKKTLEISLEYVDGTSEKIGDKLYINDSANLSPENTDNPYLEFLRAPSGKIWYRYPAKNTHPDKEVRYIKFRNINSDCTPRIGNVVHLKSKIKPLLW